VPHHPPHFGHTSTGLPVHLHTVDHLHVPGAGWYKRANTKIALWATAGVGSMTCAWLFAALALAGLKTAASPGNIGLLFWFSSDFLQLTLLSVIMVGQNVAAAASDARAAKTFEDTETLLDWMNLHTSGGLADVLAEVRNGRDDLQAVLATLRSILAADRPARAGAGGNPARSEGFPAERPVVPPAAASNTKGM
jgi:hypothetical protein